MVLFKDKDFREIVDNYDLEKDDINFRKFKNELEKKIQDKRKKNIENTLKERRGIFNKIKKNKSDMNG